MVNRELDKLLKEYTESEKRHLHGKITKHIELNSIYNILDKQIFSAENGFVISDNIILAKNQRFAEVPLHRHEYIEINYMYSGTCEQTIDGKSSLLKQGQMTFIDTKTPHSIGYTDEDDIMINFIIKKEYLNTKFFSKLSNNNLITSFFINAINDENTNLNYMIFNTEDNQRLKMFIYEFILECYKPSLNTQDIKDSLFILIILEMINTLDTSINYESITESNTLIISALQYIENNFLTCTLESTAKHLNVNACYLTTILKKHFHQSYKELIIKLRMDYAVKLLTNSSLTIDEVARKVGYQNLSFFYKKFKEIYQCSPKEYRLINSL
ncbi:MAG: AraC family transcriptional regulator [Coprobacillus sp.]